MNYTPRCYVAAAAMALAPVQHFVHVSGLALFEVPQVAWFFINSIEAAVLFTAARMLFEKRRGIAIVVGVIGACLAVSIVFTNFPGVFTPGEQYWAVMSTLLIFGLILSAVYLARP